MKQHVTAAAVALDSKPDCTDENLRKIRHWSRHAAEQGADLVVFPELSVTGFIPNHPTGNHAEWLRDVLRGARQSAEALDGPAVRELQGISAETGAFVAAGMLENAGNVLIDSVSDLTQSELRHCRISIDEAPGRTTIPRTEWRSGGPPARRSLRAGSTAVR